MSEKLEKLVEALDELTLLEAAELSKMLQEKWGVSAAAPMAMAGMPMAGAGAGEAEEEEEKTEFDVVLKEIGPKKIQVIKAVRTFRSDLGSKRPRIWWTAPRPRFWKARPRSRPRQQPTRSRSRAPSSRSS